jgi:hypothetical protein
MSAARLEETLAFPFVEVSGTPRNIGLQYGRKAAGRIHHSIDLYRRLFAGKGVDWSLARVAATTAQIMWVAPRPYGPHKFTEYRLP